MTTKTEQSKDSKKKAEEDVIILLKGVSNIAARHNELKKLRGENFNIFSILNMESKENATHSAFLGELLNPKGSHLFGTVFLRLFLESVGYADALVSLHSQLLKHPEKCELELNTAVLKLEQHVGGIDKTKKTGGRIDIYLSDNKGNSISIENKIYAGDQHAQIERYVNHNKAKNRVYYLTLWGGDASKESKGLTKDGINYHRISYRDTIVTWLDLCMKEAADQPILRESIKQYILLIKKLTNQLTNNTMAKEVRDLIAKDYLAANVIANNIGQAEERAAHRFLTEVEEAIKAELHGEEWTVKVAASLNKEFTGLVIEHSSWGGIQVKLQGASKVPWHNSDYGVRAHRNQHSRSDIDTGLADVNVLKTGFNHSPWWAYYQSIMSLNDTESRARLFDEVERKVMVKEVSTKLIELARECKEPLGKIGKGAETKLSV
jgi:hypothetical protein